MTESAKLEVYKKKLDGVCSENELVFRLHTEGYPIYMEISPASDLDDQVTMLEAAEDTPFNSPDAKLVFSMRDGDLVYRMSKRITIGDALFSKLKNLFKNIHRCYVEMFHRDVIERALLAGPYTPTSTTADDNAPIVEPLEVCELPDETGMDGELPNFDEDMLEDEAGAGSADMGIDEYLFQQAVELARQHERVGLNLLCNELGIGFAQAGRIREMLIDAGIISEASGLGGMHDTLPETEANDG